MIMYFSYLLKNLDIINNVFIIGFVNLGFELLVGIGVFVVFGFMVNNMGVLVDKVVSVGVGFVFVVFF